MSLDDYQFILNRTWSANTDKLNEIEIFKKYIPSGNEYQIPFGKVFIKFIG